MIVLARKSLAVLAGPGHGARAGGGRLEAALRLVNEVAADAHLLAAEIADGGRDHADESRLAAGIGRIVTFAQHTTAAIGGGGATGRAERPGARGTLLVSGQQTGPGRAV